MMTTSKVLIAQHDARIQNRLASFFRRIELEPFVVEASGEAFALARTGGFRLGIVDEDLPRVGGLEVVRFLGRLAERVPCILTARRSTKEAQLAALDAGAITVLETPFTDETLRLAVERFVAPSGHDPHRTDS